MQIRYSEHLVKIKCINIPIEMMNGRVPCKYSLLGSPDQANCIRYPYRVLDTVIVKDIFIVYAILHTFTSERS